MTFSALGLTSRITDNLTALGYQQPTPIQVQAIPQILAGKDLLGLAQTGTGKTAAFALPILHRLVDQPIPKRAKRWVRALVLAPTRELAQQNGQSFQTYGKGLRLRTATIFGGVSDKPQVRQLEEGADIVVATPGRLLDLLNQRHLDLRDVEVFVLDEADQMLDMGFIPDVRRIVGRLPEARQSLMFSATMPKSVSELAAQFLDKPITVQVARQGAAVTGVQQEVYFVEPAEKSDFLAALLHKGPAIPTLVFGSTRHSVDMAAKKLRKAGLPAQAFHGDKSQSLRQRTLQEFKSGAIEVLVATDIAARGIDIASIELVVNYELPSAAETYIHRIGRTARAGAEGRAISLCASGEKHRLRRIERFLKQKLAVGKPE